MNDKNSWFIMENNNFCQNQSILLIQQLNLETELSSRCNDK
jgi:hypothetical protein